MLISLTKGRIAAVFTWLILGSAEAERSLGALQTHLTPVCDSLQLHSVTAVLLQPLQIYPTLSLWQEKTLKCWHYFVTTLSLVPFPVPAQLGLGQTRLEGKPCSLRAHVDLWKVSQWDSLRFCEGAMLSEPPRASSLCLACSIPPPAWAWWVLVIDCACFDIPLPAGSFQRPRGAKVETSSTCVSRCLVFPTWCFICYTFHKLIPEKTIEVYV